MTSKSRGRQQGCCALALSMLLWVWPSTAQEVTARLSGIVKDPAGAVVPGPPMSAQASRPGPLQARPEITYSRRCLRGHTRFRWKRPVSQRPQSPELL